MNLSSLTEVLFAHLIRLGSNFGYHLVAEGIESEEMLKKLQTVGCEFGQGYHISRPTKMPRIINENEAVIKVSA